MALAAPAALAQETMVLRYLGTAVNQHQGIKEKVKQDLGITLEYIPVTSDDVVRRAVTQPNSFDILDSEYWMLKKIVPSGNLVGMDANRIKLVDERIAHWLSQGALATDRVAKFLGHAGLAPMPVFPEQPKQSAPKKKAQERAKAAAGG
jgi:putative spermidine/putrescine transport system substrate-binding protein